jgi:hypothetical protein
MNIDPNDYQQESLSNPIQENNNKKNDKNMKNKIIFVVLILIILGGSWWWAKSKNDRKGDLITIDPGSVKKETLNQGDVSPISGIACENWNRRPIAVMQPSDASARPLAGFFDADMVVEMPVLTTSKTRLMGVYICGSPEEIGSIRSARPDFVHLAKGMDAIFAHWGRAQLDSFIETLNSRAIDNLNCNGDAGHSIAANCFRKQDAPDLSHLDSAYVKFSTLLEQAEKAGYRMTSNFEGYPHKLDLPEDQRIEKGNLEIGYYNDDGQVVNYDYDKATNSYIRYWGGTRDTDRNNGNLITPKNIVVLLASDNAMEEDPHYNNMELGDPWYDNVDSGEAYYYMNGQEIRGRWSKDKSKMDSKLILTDTNGKDIEFVRGQIWVNVAYPNMKVDWDEGVSYEEDKMEE